MEEQAMVRAISLFSGIGGFELGFEQAGIETVMQVEIDDSASTVLQHHWPDVQRLSDVQKLARMAGDMGECPCGCDELCSTHFFECECIGIHQEELEGIDLIYGGFPCQDISAGRDRWGAEGIAGTRSGLWWEFHRTLERVSPEWAVIENVGRLWNGRAGTDMAAVLGSLGELGYVGCAGILDAAAFGLPARRPRAYIVARKSGQAGGVSASQRLAECWARNDPGFVVLERTGQPQPEDTGAARPTPGGYRKLTPLECERLMGFPDGWTEPAGSATSRYKLLGNAVAPPVAEWIGHLIMEASQ